MLFRGVLIILWCCFAKGDVFIPCVFGNADKCLGIDFDMIDYGIPKADSILINETVEQTQDLCFNLCAETINCFMATYKADHKLCFMYQNISFAPLLDQRYPLYLWRCCNENTSYPVDGRCPGFWKLKSKSKSFNSIRINDPILQIPNETIQNCQMVCLNNSICGAINFLTSKTTEEISCEFIIAFPVESMNTEKNSSWYTHIWQCAANYTLPIPKQNCLPRSNDDAGYFMIQGHSLRMNDYMKTVLHFHTFNYVACLRNCVMYRHCIRAWFSLKSAFCMLEASNLSKCSDTQAKNNYLFTTYVWIHCPSYYSYQLQHIQYHHKRCHKIINNQYMYIYHIKCGHPPKSIKKISNCSVPIKYGDHPIYHQTVHCQNSQSFRIISELDKQFTGLGPYSNMNWVKVFSGYESFWLANVSEETFRPCHQLECEIYNADMDSHDSKPLKFISRQEWFAQKPRGPQSPFPNFPVPFVIITDTERPFCNCFTIEACSYQIREIQSIFFSERYFAIPYNFIITGDGVVYKGKGWEHEDKATGSVFNGRSLSIALCGSFLYEEPNVKILNSIKKLIKLSVDLEKVAENYTLYVLRDVGQHNLPFNGLVSVIELWPHYRGHLRFECYLMSNFVILLNIVVSLLLLGLILCFTNVSICRIKHQKYCQTVQSYRMDSIYGKFETSRLLHDEVYQDHMDNLNVQTKFISPFTCSLFWIESRSEIGKGDNGQRCQCQTAVFSIFNICRFKSKLVDIGSIALIPELETCSKTVAFIFERNVDIDNQKLLFLHCNELSSVKHFVHRLYSEKCLCNFFIVSQYSADTKQFEYGYKSAEIATSNIIQNSLFRGNMEKRYSKRYDERNNLCFYN